MDLKTIKSAIDQIADERGLSPEIVLEAIEGAIASAYKKEYRKRSEIIKAAFDAKTGEMKFWQVKTVVSPDEVKMPEEGEELEEDNNNYEDRRQNIEIEDEEEDGLIRYNPDRHILIDEAKKVDSEAKPGDELTFPLELHEDFGRIAAQTAKQVILQNVREAERDSIRKEFEEKEGEMVSGVVQRYERGHVYVDIGRATGIMFKNESIPGEHYKTGQRLRFYVLAVQQEERRRPGIVLSRAHPNFVSRLLELEVPEISEGIVEVKRVAREPGSRTKIAVESHQENIDPVGSVVGQRGARIMAVINELGNEKIDVVEWSEDPEELIINALSPAKVKFVEIEDRREAIVLVPEDQLSLAIGKGGQNVRLAAKLSGWKIDVRSQSNPEEQLQGGIADENSEVESEEIKNSDSEEVVEEIKEVKKDKEEQSSEEKELANTEEQSDEDEKESVSDQKSEIETETEEGSEESPKEDK